MAGIKIQVLVISINVNFVAIDFGKRVVM